MHRSGRKREPPRRSFGVVLFLIVLGVAGLAVGAFFGNYIIKSLIEATAPPGGSIPGGTTPGGSTTPGGGTTPGGTGGTGGGTTPSPTKVQVIVQPYTFYSVQIGAFSDAPGAQQAARKAFESGLPSHVWEPNPDGSDRLWRVRCAILPTREAAEAVLQKVRAAGNPDAFLAQFQTRPMDLTIQATSAQYLTGFRDALQGMAELMRVEAAAWDAYAKAGLDYRALSGHLTAVSAAAAKVRQALAGLTAPADLRERHDVLVGLVNMADASAVELANAAQGTQAKYARAMTEYMKFVEAFSLICANWR